MLETILPDDAIHKNTSVLARNMKLSQKKKKEALQRAGEKVSLVVAHSQYAVNKIDKKNYRSKVLPWKRGV